METLERIDTNGGSDGPTPLQSEAAGRATTWYLKAAAGIAITLGLLYWAVVEEKIRSTLITVVITVAASAGLWIAANMLFNQVRSRWAMFNAIAFALMGAVLGVLLHGNRLTVGSGSGFVPWAIGPAIGATVLGTLGYVMTTRQDPVQRQIIATTTGLAAGVLIAVTIREQFQPGLDFVAIVVYTAVFAAIGAGLSLLLKHSPVGGIMVGAAIGWIIGAWGGADLGDGSLVESLVATVVPAVLIGARFGMTSDPDYSERVNIDTRSRAVIFVGPAILFIFAMLVVPAIRTGYLSLLDRTADDFVGGENYGSVFSDRNSLDLDNWTNMFTSVPFLIGVVLLGIAIVVGVLMKQRTGRAVEIGNPTVGPLVVGLILVSFGAFTAMRGTLINNLWWVVVVTFFSTALGLAIAVLADGRRGERVAKSIIFMPMAISLVGASIIWRFVYLARDTSTEQTGVMNALWVGLGRLSTGSGLPTLIVTVLLAIFVVLALIFLSNALVKREFGRAIVPGILVVLLGWFLIRFTGLIGGGVGGFKIADDGTVAGQTIFFVQEPPYANFWLMVIMIWIQTGFAMVILSSAIKAVPTELIEAAKIDGATESQAFWRVVLPQIATTIGVIVTTLIVGVMKVFDIVKVTTNGQFGTQVLANNMFDEAFNRVNIGKGAALAMLIFFSVLPVMIFNIRKMQQEG